MKSITLVAIVVLSISLLPFSSFAQNCGCAPGQCCSQFGFCGSTEAFCGPGCQSGPCGTAALIAIATPTSTTPTNGGGSSVSSVVTQSFFDGIIGQAAASCPGKNFYTRDAFLNALGNYPQFGTSGANNDDNLREIAAFFAHVAHETGRFCHIEENDGAATNDVFCDASNTQYTCVSGKKYYGRGPLQLTWNFNYGAAGQSIGFDGLNAPETVANDVVISFKTALWFWMNNVHSVLNQGFGASIRAINGGVECNGGNPSEVNDRIQLYQQYCGVFGVDPGQNLSC
ncbi:acidic endochitinase SP2-like [Silene latifolia]|uniref:acidic endochitinase SP2-like n=1 Tax=Silene latifolia TaxID=37657 RepID=UPI003D77078A